MQKSNKSSENKENDHLSKNLNSSSPNFWNLPEKILHNDLLSVFSDKNNDILLLKYPKPKPIEAIAIYEEKSSKNLNENQHKNLD